MPEKRPFLSASVRWDGFFDVILLLALAGTWLGLLGHWHWALDLFSHFRWQYLGICLLALGWTLWRKRRFTLICSLASLLLNGWLIGRASLPDPAASAVQGEVLKVVSLNVLTSNPNKEGVLNYLRSQNADIIFLMEVDAVWAEAMRPLTETHPHHLMRSQRDNFGSALFSRLPLENLRLVEHGDSGILSIQADLKWADRELTLLGAHPVPPMGPSMAWRRDVQLKAMGEAVRDLKRPTLVIGDLNATPWSRGMRLLMESEVLGHRSTAAASRPTWKVGTIFALPIDHALCTAPLVISSRVIGPDLGSDHRPQELELGWAP